MRVLRLLVLVGCVAGVWRFVLLRLPLPLAARRGSAGAGLVLRPSPPVPAASSRAGAVLGPGSRPTQDLRGTVALLAR